MKQITSTIRDGLPRLLSAALLGSALTVGPVLAADGIDPDTADILKSMSSYMAKTKAFSVNTDIDFEVVTKNGQKLELSSYATVVLERPKSLHIGRKGMFADAEFIYDGRTLTLHGKRANKYAQIEAPGTIDDAILAYEASTGIPAPGADLLFADPYKVLSRGVEESVYLGTTYIDGIKCDHLAFREEEVDWQLWVQAGETPLPMKYVITSKLQAAAPEYEITFRDWNTNPKIDKKAFTFSAQGAEKLDITKTIDQIDSFASSKEDR
jgi:hypothetical protein